MGALVFVLEDFAILFPGKRSEIYYQGYTLYYYLFQHLIIFIFHLVYRSVGIPALLDVEDMVRLKKPEPRSVQCYVQMIFSKYRPKDLDMSNLIIA